MEGHESNQVKACYNLAAKEYAETFLHELDHKPFDRSILDRFSDMLPEASLIYDFGCGPGQTTKYIHDKNRHKVIGLDFSENAVRLARQNFNDIEFIVDDMLGSKMASSSANGILAFYAIVHFTYPEVEQTLQEWLRLLKPGGICLFSFTAGEEFIDIKDFLGVRGANATWHLLDVDRVLEIARGTGFKVEEAVIRYPYIGFEHERKRAYILMKKGDLHE